MSQSWVMLAGFKGFAAHRLQWWHCLAVQRTNSDCAAALLVCDAQPYILLSSYIHRQTQSNCDDVDSVCAKYDFCLLWQ